MSKYDEMGGGEGEYRYLENKSRELIEKQWC